MAVSHVELVVCRGINMEQRINVTQSSMPTMKEYMEEISTLWESRWLTNMGEKHEALTKELERYLDVKNLSLMSNGHMALEMAIQALGLTGEVITTPFTFVSTTHAIIRNRLTPVFCDINITDYTIDTEKIESLITPRTTAILPVHVYGSICNVEEIDRIARKHGLKVIYDAAHAFGVRKDNIGIANYGDISIFSFHATKVFHTIEGGAVVYRDKEIGERLYDLKNFGIHGPERVDSVGANAKMNEFQAAMGLCNLRHIDEEIQKRKHVTERYQKRLGDIEGIMLRRAQESVQSNYAYFPIFIDWKKFGKSRNEIYEQMKRKNIIARKYFYPLTSEFECYRGQFDVTLTPIALEASRQVLALPIYASLKYEVIDQICDIILS